MFKSKRSVRTKLAVGFYCASALLCAFALHSFGQGQNTTPRLKAYTWVKPVQSQAQVEYMKNYSAANPGHSLPLFNFITQSSRDGSGGDSQPIYQGTIVGDPTSGPQNIPTFVVPLIIKTHTIGTKVNPDGSISTKPGNHTFNPTVADTNCLGTMGNNVPSTLFQQSPLIVPATFVFGGTLVGTTQYVDAFQRANFWAIEDQNLFHTNLNPVKTLKAIVIDVPADKGLALATNALGPPNFCAPMGIIDINWFDLYVNTTVLPALVGKGVNPSNFPIFLVHNLVWGFPPINTIFDCCVLGYHGSGDFVPTQTYSPMNFDSTGLFGVGALDTAVAAHEVAEWMNDPFGNNPTPPWGHTGQVGGCQNNLEVGDPLTGTIVAPVVMANGFTYHLQELAFFSWFYGADPLQGPNAPLSLGIHGWFSNNGTFLTNAGPPCQ